MIIVKHCIALLLLSSAALSASPDTLYSWDFPDSSWTPNGECWSWESGWDFIRAHLDPPAVPFQYSTESGWLTSPTVVVPAGCDSLWLVLDFEKTVQYYSTGGDCLGWYSTALILTNHSSSDPQADTLWKHSQSWGSSADDSTFSTGPFTTSIESVSPGDQISFEMYCYATLYEYYGTNWIDVQWDVKDLTLMTDEIAALRSSTWGAIKSGI